MLQKAKASAVNAKMNGDKVIVTDIDEYNNNNNNVLYFVISDDYKKLEPEAVTAYAVYQIGPNIYYRDAGEFYLIILDLSDKVPGVEFDKFKVSYKDVTTNLNNFDMSNVDDCLFLVSSIFSSLTGNSYDELDESCKIRRNTKLSSDEDFDNSKIADEAKYGTDEEHKFKQEIEDKQKKDDIIGALDPLGENEGYKPKLPNVNLIEESIDIEYEVNDKVIFNKEIWHVTAVTNTIDDKQHLRITNNGQSIDVTSNLVKPDPNQLKDIDPSLADKFEFDKNNLNVTPKNPKAEKMTDLNGKTVECNIVIDSTVLKNTLNGEKFKANLQDVMEGLDDIRVYVGDDEQNWKKEQIQIEQENWPYAVIASDDDEPLRKIKVDPTSYVNATDENDLVDCIISDRLTQIPKRVIRVIS